ncbi:hypothetical protein TRVL_10191 [Trypanosoma vivax]|nr:hypothetical protein TRVL_10191 [Trypanosoma vivax]
MRCRLFLQHRHGTPTGSAKRVLVKRVQRRDACNAATGTVSRRSQVESTDVLQRVHSGSKFIDGSRLSPANDNVGHVLVTRWSGDGNGTRTDCYRCVWLE